MREKDLPEKHVYGSLGTKLVASEIIILSKVRVERFRIACSLLLKV